MTIIDIVIIIALLVSVIIGFVRGIVKEAISIATLIVAIWAALYFGPSVGDLSESWLSSEELQTWFGRALVFSVILAVGSLIGWGVSKLVRLSLMSGVDRLLGSMFGALRGVLLVALFIIGGQFAGFDNDEWWLRSQALPYFEVVADWIKVMAPKGYELIIPDETAESLPLELPVEL
jgi:membrane protein required for colicin V production